jgi:hypothetical protein
MIVDGVGMVGTKIGGGVYPIRYLAPRAGRHNPSSRLRPGPWSPTPNGSEARR